jgi:hypothetical protein
MKCRSCGGSLGKRKVCHPSGFRRELETYAESDKNRLLRRTAEKQHSHTAEMIAKPKGSIGAPGFNLITEMKLDKKNPKDKELYNDILVSYTRYIYNGY